MTDQLPTTKPPLGAGAIIGGSFSVFYARFGVFFLLAFVPIVLLQLFNLWLAGSGVAIGLGGARPPSALDVVWALVVALAPSLIAYALVTALVVLAAYDVKLGRPVRIGACFRVALTRWVPVLIVSVIVYACVAATLAVMFLFFGLLWMYLGAPAGVVLVVVVLLIFSVPVMYVFTILSVAVTAVVVERIGLRAIGRSVSLTRNYRWPVLGTLLVLYISVFGVGWALGWVLIQLPPPEGLALYLFRHFLAVAISSVTTGILAVGHVLIYARLREIKEGVTVDRLVEVFD